MIVNSKPTHQTASRFAVVVLQILVLAACSPLCGADLQQKLNEYLDAAASVNQFHGSVLVARAGETLVHKGYGFADVEHQVKNEPDTRYLIGSVTKQFTAAVVLLLEQEGKLSLADPIGKYLPDYPDPAASEVTIHMLLSHTSGIADFTSLPNYLELRTQDKPLSFILNSIMTLPLQFEPGSQYSYSNSNYKILEAVISEASGETWHDLVQNRILDKAGMTNTGYGFYSSPAAGRAVGYTRNQVGDQVAAVEVVASVPGAAGALYSTTSDLYRWSKALDADAILDTAVKVKMFTPVLSGYACGWSVDSLMGHYTQQHTGGIDGFASIIARFPDDDIFITILSNSDVTSTSQMMLTMAAILFDKPYDIPVKRAAVKLESSRLSEYVGYYQVNDTSVREVMLREGQLMTQRDGGPTLPIEPESPDFFFYSHDNSSTLKFDRDENNNVVSQRIHQNGQDSFAKKISPEEARRIAALDPRLSAVDPQIYARYVGTYQLNAGIFIEVTREGDHLFVQATGQSKLEVFPESETRFFLKVADAAVEFVQGSNDVAEKLILDQGGRRSEAVRVR